MPIKLGSVDVGISNPPSDDATYGRKNGDWVDLASSAALQFRQGTEADRQNLLTPPASGEPIYVTDTNRLFIGDGVTLGGRGLVTDSDSYVVCQPGDNIQAKYEQAKLLTPGGNTLSATNRAALLVLPGRYAVVETADYAPDGGKACLDVDTDFVDVIGLGSQPRRAAVFLAPAVATDNAFRVSASDVVVVGLEATYSQLGTALGGKQRIVRCGGVRVAVLDTGGYSDALLFQCYTTSTTSTATLVGSWGTAGAGFSGLVDDCYVAGVCRNASLTGTVRRCEHRSTNFFLLGTIHQARASFGDAPTWSSLPNRGGFYEGALTSISVGSPAVCTESIGHSVKNWCRLQFTTTGTLPTGLSTGTTYYAKNVDAVAGTFEVASSIGGDSIATTGAGSGTHSIVNPAGKDGGWCSYYALKTTDASNT